MSATVKVANARNYNQKALSMRLPTEYKFTVNPLRAEKIPIPDRSVCDGWETITGTSAPAFGKTSTFTIPNSVGSIYGLLCNITLASTTGVTYAPLIAAKMIAQYTVNVSNELINCTGRGIYFASIKYANKSDRIFQALNCGPTTTLTSLEGNTYSIRLPFPGSINTSVVNATWGPDDSYGIPFPLNRCNSNMIIKITLASLADICTVGTPAAPSVEIMYQAVWSSNEADNSVNISGTGTTEYVPSMFLTEYPSAAPYSPTVENNINISSSIQDGELSAFLVQFSSAAQVTALSWAGVQMGSMRLRVAGTDYYKSDSPAQITFKEGNMYREEPYAIDYANTNYNYCYLLPMSINPWQIVGTEWAGVDLQNLNPTLYYKSASTTDASGTIWVCSITKCLYEITPAGSVNRYFNAQN